MKKIFLLAFIISAISFVESAESKEYKLSDVDLNFIVNIPDKAKYTSKENKNKVLSFIEVKMPDKSVFMLTLHPMKKDRYDAKSLKPMLIERGEEFAKESDEGKLELLELKREIKVVGNYFSFTDKQPQEGEFKYMSQGVVDYNFVFGSFTYLTNNKESWPSFGGIDPVSILSDSIKDKVTKNFENVKLTKEELSQFEPSIIEHFYSRQQVILHENTDVYKAILSNLKEKYSQSFNNLNNHKKDKNDKTDKENKNNKNDKSDKINKNDKNNKNDINNIEECTIFYYYFNNKLGEDQQAFLTGLFYGEKGKPSDEHPETFFIKDNYLIVFSFPNSSKLHKELSELIAGKFKN
jgi:hypothetical protein